MTILQASLERKLVIEKDNPPPTHLERETPLHEHDTTIASERLESDHRWLAGRERDEREERESLSKDREEEKGEWQKLSTPLPPRTFIQVVTRRHVLVRRQNIPGYMHLRSVSNALQEDYQDQYDAVSHTTSQDRSLLSKLQSSLYVS